MYGYVVVNKPELKFREFDVYRSYYCGLCEVLKDKYGISGQISINYDMTFLIMLLTGLYEPETEFYESRCIAHPAAKHQVRKNNITQYAADMNVLMAYYKCMDDWLDEKKITRRTLAAGLKKHFLDVENHYADKAAEVKDALQQISDMEQQEETDIDKVASCFGIVMGNIISMQDDEWKDMLYHMGFSLGKFIYILDAYEDLSQDIKAGRYNVLKTHMDMEGFDDFCESILNSIMADCARYFEMLPILKDVEILRNIIYSGVWTRFEMARRKKEKGCDKGCEKNMRRNGD